MVVSYILHDSLNYVESIVLLRLCVIVSHVIIITVVKVWLAVKHFFPSYTRSSPRLIGTFIENHVVMFV